jgi:hypothetical protein
MTPNPPPTVTSIRLPRAVPDARYATASDDGATIALALAQTTDTGEVAVLRGDAPIERMPGWLVPATGPLVATVADGADGADRAAEVALRDVVRGTTYRAPREVDGLGWDERTAWRVAAGGLLRVVTAKSDAAATLAWYGPDQPAPRWQVALPAGVADVAIAGPLAIAQLTATAGAPALIAIDTRTGAQAWRIATAATYADQGAVILAERSVLTVLGDPGRCESCEQVEVHDVTTGARVRTVALDGPSILARLGARGRETVLGVAGAELWFRFQRTGVSHDGALANACTFDAFDLHTGKARSAAAPWAAALANCAPPVLAAPIAAGLVTVRRDDARAEVARFTRAP